MFSEDLNILIIDDNNAPFILPLIRCFSGCSSISVDVLVFSPRKPNLFRHSKYLRNVYHHRGEVSDDFEAVLRDTLKKSKAQVIIPTREWISQAIAENKEWISELANIHLISDRATIETVTDKWKLNLFLERNKFPCSKVLPVSQNTVADAKAANFPFPALLKPQKGAGGIGIRPVGDAEELGVVLSGDKSYLSDYFLQELIEGFDIDMSLFSRNGEILFYTIQRGIMSGSYVFPKGIELIKNQDLFELGRSIIGKLNYTGIAHMDFRYDTAKKQYILVDFNPRYWSSLQGSRIMGVNFPLLAVAVSVGLKVESPTYSNGYFYYGTAAVKQMFRNLWSRNRYPVRFKNSQLASIVRDPLPELFYLLNLLIKPFRVIFGRK